MLAVSVPAIHVLRDVDGIDRLVVAARVGSTADVTKARNALAALTSTPAARSTAVAPARESKPLMFSRVHTLPVRLDAAGAKPVDVDVATNAPAPKPWALGRRPGSIAKDALDLSNFFANDGLLGDSDDNVIPDRVDALLVPSAGAQGATDLAARLGLESAGISIPIAVTADSVTEPEEDPHREEEARTTRDPAGAVWTQSTAGDDAMDVGMMLELLPPRVQDEEETDLRAEVLRVGGNRPQRRRRRPKQDAVHRGFVPAGDLGDRLGHRKDDVEGRTVEDLGLAPLDPFRARQRLALRTVAIRECGVTGLVIPHRCRASLPAFSTASCVTCVPRMSPGKSQCGGRSARYHSRRICSNRGDSIT